MNDSFDDIPDWRIDENYPSDVKEWPLGVWRFEFIRRTKDYRDEYDSLGDNTLNFRMKWRLTQPFDPRKPLPNGADITTGLNLFFSGGDKRGMWDEIEWAQQDHIAAMTIDLSKPIKAQMLDAVEMLEMFQRHLYRRKVSERHHYSKWPMYLRALSAHICGASYSEIADILPATVARNQQTARDIVGQASDLCFKL